MMTQHEIEKKLIKMESMVSDIHAMLMMVGVRSNQVCWAQYDRALQAFIDGDPKPLKNYIERGGVVPTAAEAEEHHKHAA